MYVIIERERGKYGRFIPSPGNSFMCIREAQYEEWGALHDCYVGALSVAGEC